MNVEVKVQRDTDGDRTPDVRDDDDDNDGISDEVEKQKGTNPKVKDTLTATVTNPADPVVEGVPYTNTDVVVTANKPGATISSSPVHGLSVNDKGQITGTPSLTPEEWGTDEVKTVTIPVTVSHEGDQAVTVNVEVKVLRSSRNGQPEIQEEISEYTKPIGTTGVDESGNLLEPPLVDIPEYTEPIGTTGVDENGNLLEPPVVDIPEYTEPIGTTGVDENGNLITPPSYVESQKIKVVITKWTDEQGNDLKQPDAKVPSVPGEANEAFEPGEIDGYIFVRTELKGNVVTHIFRKVSSAETSGGNKPQSKPEVPTDNTEHKPEVITPNEQTTETENPTVKPKASQNILPNTGTADGLGIFSKAVASILAGLGLFLPVKKEDEDEEETQNN